MKWVACTRMYDVTPEAREHWHAILRTVATTAGVAIECIDHAPPAPLEALWGRSDLAMAFMCGFPLATRYPEVRPLAAPVSVLQQDASPAYRSVWLVRANSAFDTLPATFAHRLGWTVAHSHSGFNAPRYALLAHRTAERPRLFDQSVGPLGHPRAALRALAEQRIDVVALDAYWWWLLQRYDRDAAGHFRAVGETASAPMPPLICAPEFPEASARRLVEALAVANGLSTTAPHLAALGLRGFAAVARADYAPLAEMERIAVAANYRMPG